MSIEGERPESAWRELDFTLPRPLIHFMQYQGHHICRRRDIPEFIMDVRLSY